MKIGSPAVDAPVFKNRRLSELPVKDRDMAIDAMKHREFWNPEWDNQQHPDQGLTFPTIASKYGNPGCENDRQPDPDIPSELFNFDLILNSRKFRVLCDSLLRIRSTEDLAGFSDKQLMSTLEQCASYRLTCFCAHVAAHKEYTRWKTYHEEWLAQKREEARQQIRAERLADRATGLRKEIGQITAQELEDQIWIKYPAEYRNNQALILDWEQNEQVFLELRDTLKDRGMHLQTILRMSGDHTAHMTSSGEQT